MQRTVKVKWSMLIGRDPKTRSPRAYPNQPANKTDAPLPPKGVLWTLGFNEDGSAESYCRRWSMAKMEHEIRKFHAENPKDDSGITGIFAPEIIVGVGCRKWLLVAGEASVVEELPEGETFQFSEDFGRRDMTHRGASDWYDDKEPEIVAAVASGKPFDTGWHGCKHEILSTRISCDGEQGYCCEASVSDDFDTPGMGRVEVAMDEPSVDKRIEAIREALDEAWDLADADLKDNRCYRGFSIHNKKGAWVETYIQRWNGSDYMDAPPGDEYHTWGFQGDGARISKAVKEKLEDWAQSLRGKKGEPTEFKVGNWTIKKWED